MSVIPIRRRHHRPVVDGLLTRDKLPETSPTRQAFDKLVAEIEADLDAPVSAIDRELVEVFVGAALTIRVMNCAMARGRFRRADFPNFASAAAVMSRIAQRLDVRKRSAAGGVPDPLDYARDHEEDVA